MLSPLPAPNADLPAPLFFGDGLFSSHYLQDRLPHSDLWAGANEADAAFAPLKQVYAAIKAALPTGNEEDVEDRLVAPVLTALGFGFEKRRVMITGGGGKGYPDFLLYETPADANAAFDSKNFYSRCIGLLEAKRWGVPLQTPATSKARSPHLQLRDYLNEHPAIGYGIATNGGQWRLYARTAPASDFLAVDLARVLSAPDGDKEAAWAFRLFYTLFARRAFADNGRVLSEARTGAERFREEIEEQLRRQVFDAMETLARGFLHNFDNGLTADRDLPAIYDNSLILLYRILFVLNAEARDLLPVGTESVYYKTCGLELVRRKLASATDAAEYGDTGTFALWGRLEGLFALINGSDAARNQRYDVPRYNGGLFDPARYPFLQKCRVGDLFLRDALQTLTFRKDTTNNVTAFDYAGLGERHLGSIYEGLLEHVLRPDAALVVKLANDKGERKTQGAYYTPQPWVSYLVGAALSPLLAAIEQTHDVQNGTANSFAHAVLALNVCDPAMGSGHFLVEATLFLANRVAAHPTTETGDAAYWKRRVVEACIYGVDLNPLAVELAKLSLWLATVDRVPLNFLDHHLLCGNSLVGTTLDALPNFPDPKRKKVAGKKGAVMQLSMGFAADLNSAVRDAIAGIHEIEATSTDTHEIAKHKETLWRNLSENVVPRFTRVADMWTAPYFGANFSFVTFDNLTTDPDLGRAKRNEYTAVLDALRPFHFELQFPDVFFTENGTPKADPGFDAVIGNPPWERVKLAENEFFAARDEQIAQSVRASDRKALIADLPQTNPELWADWETARTRSENLAAFLQKSGFYPLMGVGDTNLYAVFVERATTIAAKRGRVALLVPSGIATDQTTSAFFRSIVQAGRLSELLDFENKAGVFPNVHRSFKFSIIVFGGADDKQATARCGFFLHQIEDAQNPARVFDLSPADFATFNPNTLTCPIFRSRADAERTRTIYKAAPILIRRREEIGNAVPSVGQSDSRTVGQSDSRTVGQSDSRTVGQSDSRTVGQSDSRTVGQSDSRTVGQSDSRTVGQSDSRTVGQSDSRTVGQSDSRTVVNPWGVRFLRMFDMTNDSARFKTFGELDKDGYWEGPGHVMTKAKTRYLPLYEGKMVQMYDHRAASVKINLANQFRAAQEDPTDDAQHADPEFSPMPQYFVDEDDVVCATSLVPRALASAYAAKSPKLILNAFGLWLAGWKWVEGDDVLATRLFNFATGDMSPISKLILGVQVREWATEFPWSEGNRAIANELVVATIKDIANHKEKDIITENEETLQFAKKIMYENKPAYLMGYKSVTAPTNARSMILSAIPLSGVGNSMAVIQTAANLPPHCLLANLSALVLDYTARQKIGGQNLNFFIVEQLPVLPPETYLQPLPSGDKNTTFADFIKVRVLPLVYTAHDMSEFARSLGFDGPPFAWEPEKRLRARCELDALFFVLYGLDASETAAILDTFPIVRKTDEARYGGKFRTRDLILNYRKAYAAGNWDAQVSG